MIKFSNDDGLSHICVFIGSVCGIFLFKYLFVTKLLVKKLVPDREIPTYIKCLIPYKYTN